MEKFIYLVLEEEDKISVKTDCALSIKPMKHE